MPLVVLVGVSCFCGVVWMLRSIPWISPVLEMKNIEVICILEDCKNLIRLGRPGKAPGLRFIDEYLAGHHVGTRWRIRCQGPVLWPNCSECSMLFPSQLCVLSVGRDTELQISPENRCGDIWQSV